MDTIELDRCFGLWVILTRILNLPHLGRPWFTINIYFRINYDTRS